MTSAEAPAIRSTPGCAPFDSCPTCSGNAFDADASQDRDGGRPVFRCVSCGAGWLYELGYVRPIDRS